MSALLAFPMKPPGVGLKRLRASYRDTWLHPGAQRPRGSAPLCPSAEGAYGALAGDLPRNKGLSSPALIAVSFPHASRRFWVLLWGD